MTPTPPGSTGRSAGSPPDWPAPWPGARGAVLDTRDDIDGWLGLGESLVHYAAFSGASPQDARPAFDRMVALDSSFAPLYYHLVDLAVYAGDSAAAGAALRRLRTDHPYWP